MLNEQRHYQENFEGLMSIKTKTFEEAKRKLHDKYGENYEIVERSHCFDSQFLGLITRERIEVKYRIKNQDKFSSKPEVPAKPVLSKVEAQNFEKNKTDIIRNTIGTNLDKKISGQTEKLDIISNALDDIKSKSGEKHNTIKRIQQLLENNDFTNSYIQMITEKIESTFSLKQLDDFNYVQRYVVDWIGESILCHERIVYRRPHVAIIVGPTGVGKTTTLVKLATMDFNQIKTDTYRPSVYFITVDTMRVGAYQQLERWGQWFETTVLAAQNAEEVAQKYSDIKDSADFIYIDTSGYSPNDSVHIGALKSMLDVPALQPEIFLAVSATTKTRDIENIIRNYEPFGFKSVIVTKCDESKQYGNVISALWEKQKSVAYITNGQHIAKTIQKATVVDFLSRLEGFSVDRVHIEDKFGEN